MRIIGGRFGSRPLTAPRGMATRPTLDQTREALFNILQARVADSTVLDLYAGSGAIALEALSRGASSAVLCDQSPAACTCIRENIARLGCGGMARLLAMPDRQALQLLERENARFDLIYLDPPYAMDLGPVLALLAPTALLAEDGLIIAEHSRTSDPACPEGLTLTRRKLYRDTALSFYQRDHGPQEGPSS